MAVLCLPGWLSIPDYIEPHESLGAYLLALKDIFLTYLIQSVKTRDNPFQNLESPQVAFHLSEKK